MFSESRTLCRRITYISVTNVLKCQWYFGLKFILNLNYSFYLKRLYLKKKSQFATFKWWKWNFNVHVERSRCFFEGSCCTSSSTCSKLLLLMLFWRFTLSFWKLITKILVLRWLLFSNRKLCIIFWYFLRIWKSGMVYDPRNWFWRICGWISKKQIST